MFCIILSNIFALTIYSILIGVCFYDLQYFIVVSGFIIYTIVTCVWFYNVPVSNHKSL